MKALFVIWVLVMALIAVVDWFLGPVAEYLNAYEILRRSCAPFLPGSSHRFLLGQDSLGDWALIIGWLAWGLEALVIELIFYWLGGSLV
jgi:hypothetical protein